MNRGVMGVVFLSCFAVIASGCGEDCKKQDQKVCSDDAVYWADSCGKLGVMLETCPCGCNADYSDCQDFAAECLGDSIRGCLDGDWMTLTCQVVGASSDDCYSGSCGYSESDGHDVCYCESCESSKSTVTFRITDACNDGNIIHYRFFDSAAGWVWPDADNVYVADEYDTTYASTLECNTGARICHGAASVEGEYYGSGYWGVGIDGSHGCDSCCYDCVEGLSEGWRLTCD
jgi:hypothetical protein